MWCAYQVPSGKKMPRESFNMILLCHNWRQVFPVCPPANPLILHEPCLPKIRLGRHAIREDGEIVRRVQKRMDRWARKRRWLRIALRRRIPASCQVSCLICSLWEAKGVKCVLWQSNRLAKGDANTGWLRLIFAHSQRLLVELLYISSVSVFVSVLHTHTNKSMLPKRDGIGSSSPPCQNQACSIFSQQC